MKVLIIDYGMGNVGSVKRAIEECNVENVVISNDYKDFDDCTHAILPGVGAFPDAMSNLKVLGLDLKIKELAIDKKVPLLGICLGMQLLATTGFEGRETNGLDLIPGTVSLLHPPSNEKIPHVGWNEINYDKHNHPLFQNIPDKGDFYFVHSYHFSPVRYDDILTYTPYCGQFVSTVRSGNIYGTQFHPEKSSVLGFQLLKNFLLF